MILISTLLFPLINYLCMIDFIDPDLLVLTDLDIKVRQFLCTTDRIRAAFLHMFSKYFIKIEEAIMGKNS